MASKTSPQNHRTPNIYDREHQRDGTEHSTANARAAEIAYLRGKLTARAAGLALELATFHNRCVDLISSTKTLSPELLAELALSLDARGESAHNSVMRFREDVQKLQQLSKAPPL